VLRAYVDDQLTARWRIWKPLAKLAVIGDDRDAAVVRDAEPGAACLQVAAAEQTVGSLHQLAGAAARA
jgi:hypothetical protein